MVRKFRSERIARKHKRIFWTKFVFFWLFLAIFTFSFSYMSKLEKINILNINIIGNKIIEDEDILEIVNENIEGNYFKLISKSNILLYPKSKIKSTLLEKFLRIEDLVISFENLNSININIVERKPFALYCKNKENEILMSSEDEEMATSTSLGNDFVLGIPNKEECYFMDDAGYIYAEAMSFSQDVYFKYLNETSLSLDKTYLSESREEQFEKVNLFIRYLKDININVYCLMVKENGDYELIFDRDSILIFDEKQDFDILLENLHAVLIDLGDLSNKEFEYIDLRFDNKVLYKFRK